jgi:hypothetical protein
MRSRLVMKISTALSSNDKFFSYLSVKNLRGDKTFSYLKTISKSLTENRLYQSKHHLPSLQHYAAPHNIHA